ncbi:MAG: PAS domain S-box protein [Candidatus Zixiibacteriota bacterium]
MHEYINRISFAEIADIDALKATFKKFSSATGFAVGLVEFPSQDVLISTGWHKVCTEFHRKHQSSQKYCLKSNRELTSKLKKQKQINIRRCDNGLIDGAAPIIVDGFHIASIFIGHILFKEPDMAYFKAQAKKFGFDEDAYLQALQEVPIIPRDKFRKAIEFLADIAEMIAEKGIAELKSKRKAYQLRQNENKYKYIIKHTPNAIAVFDKELRYLAASDRYLKDYNVKIEEIIGNHHYAVFPEIPEKWRKVHKKALSGKIIKKDDDYFRRPDGTLTYTSWECRPWYDTNGNIAGIITYTEVITERKLAERALKKSEADLRSIYNAAKNVAFIKTNVKGKDSQIIKFSPGAEIIFGYKEEEVLGKPVSILHTQKDADSFQNVLDDMQNGLPGFNGECNLIRENGNEFTGFFTTYPIFDENGNMKEALGVTTDITERKKHENRINRILKTVPDMVSVQDKNMNIIYSNWNGFANVPEEKRIIGSKCYNTYRGFDDICPDCQAQKVLETHKPYQVEKHLPDGRCFDIRVLPIFDDKNKSELFVEWVRDITEQKIAEEALKTSETRLRSYIENAPEGIFITDETGKYVEVNKAAQDITGYTESELQSMKVGELIPDEGKKVAFEHFKRVKKDGIAIEDIPFITKDGQKRIWSVKAVKIDENRYIAFTNDITDKKEAEKALRKSEEKYRSIFQNTAIGIGIRTLDRRYVAFNKYYQEILGYTEEELKHLKTEDITHPDDIEICIENLNAIRSGKASVRRYQKRYIRKDGEIVWTEISLRAIKDNDGNIIAISGVVNDITERKRSEEALRKYQKLESIGTLAGGIAHDFNNLLMSLFGNISIARSEIAGGHPAIEPLENAEKSMSRATKLTKQLLTFSKGGNPIIENVDMKHLIQESVKFDLSGSNVRAVYDIPNDLWNAKVDKGQIHQVISNLVINGAQAMPGGGHIYIKLENKVIADNDILNLKKGKYIKLTVRDEGIGIEEKNLERIFDPYFSTKQKGSGLGLATTYSIIKRHGGHISVKSKLGEGTIFSILIPATDKKPKKENADIISDEPVKSLEHKILVMDDDDMICEVVNAMLGRLGYNTTITNSGEEAIEEFRKAYLHQDPFGAVILDLTIPGKMGGQETVQEILRIDPDAKCIVASGYASDEALSSYQDYGFVGAAEKPYSMDKLKSILNSIFSGDSD